MLDTKIHSTCYYHQLTVGCGRLLRVKEIQNINNSLQSFWRPLEATVFIKVAMLTGRIDDLTLQKRSANCKICSTKVAQEERSKRHKNIHNSPSGDHAFLQKMSWKRSLWLLRCLTLVLHVRLTKKKRPHFTASAWLPAGIKICVWQKVRGIIIGQCEIPQDC